MTDFTPCPKTIRLCIEALSKTARIIDPTMKAGMRKWTDGWDAAIEENRAALEALLPDEAEELVREWGGIPGDPDHEEWINAAHSFLSWLIEQGKVRP